MEKQIKILQYKIADIDAKQRLVKFYYSAFDNIDSDGDVIRKGATLKSIKERGPGGSDMIRHFVNHEFKQNPAALPVGKIKEMGEDTFGAWALSKMARTNMGEDIYKLYEDGFINNHSFGFVPVKINKTKSGMEILEVKIFEVSTVTTIAANEHTPTIEVKDDKGADQFITPEDYKTLFIKPSTMTLKQEAVMREFTKLFLETNRFKNLKP